MADRGAAPGLPDTQRPSGHDTARLALVVGALGVVFGDIGTSPIYTLQTVFNPSDPHPVPVSPENVYGVVSLVFWSVVIIVLVTYVLLAMRADNEGEGGIMALITLLRRSGSPRGRRATAALAALAFAFGMAVTGTITITTLLFFCIARARWGTPVWLVAIGATVLLFVDLLFVAANATKLLHGAWLPLLIGLTAFTVMTTWQRGRELVTAERARHEGPLREFVDRLHSGGVPALDSAQTEGQLQLDQASYFLSKIELRRGKAPTMAPWRKRLFIATSYITADAAEYFGLPRDRTVIMGSHIEV
ncbi:KUP/HAK/KT family potassium transporter [Kitasatospora sp. NBC_00070]|uniref:KUP/HAK/KT family potassium transporter n=1 Tax=Kitasatospora sp. NBC_00070 TaxID=2975962 RepID=UPI00324C525F